MTTNSVRILVVGPLLITIGPVVSMGEIAIFALSALSNPTKQRKFIFYPVQV
jgi:hypothetical protein